MQRVSKFADFQTCDNSGIAIPLGNFIPWLFNASKGLILSILTNMNCKVPQPCSFSFKYHDGQLRVRFARHGKWPSTDKIFIFKNSIRFSYFAEHLKKEFIKVLTLYTSLELLHRTMIGQGSF